MTFDQVAKARRTGKARRAGEDAKDAEIAKERIAEIEKDPKSLVKGKALQHRLAALEQ